MKNNRIEIQNNDKMSGITAWLKYMAMGMGIVFLVALLMMQVSNTSIIFFWEDNYVLRDNIWIHFGSWIVMMAAGCLGFKALEKCGKYKRAAVIGFSVLFTGLCVWYIVNTGYIPRADQEKIIKAAHGIIKGDMSCFETGGYLHTFHHQIGMTLLSIIMQLIVGYKNFIGLQLINMLFYMVSVFFLYLIVKELYGRYAVISAVIFVLFIPYTLYIPFLYGTVPGMMATLACVYCFIKSLKTERVKYILFTFVSGFLAVMMKSNYMIFIIGLICVLLVEIIKDAAAFLVKKEKFGLKKPALLAALILLIALVNPLMEASADAIYGQKVPEGIPSITYAAMGLQKGDRAPGWHNTFYRDLFDLYDYDMEMVGEASKAAIAASLEDFKNDPLGAAAFFYKKTATQWANPTFQCFWNLNRCDGKKGISRFMKSLVQDKTGRAVPVRIVFDYIESFIVFCALLYFILGFFRIKIEELVFLIPFMGGFLFHLVWEAKAQYTVVYFVLLIPYAIQGLRIVYETINNLVNNRKYGYNKEGISILKKTVCVFAGCVVFALLLQVLPMETLDVTVRSEADVSTYNWMMENSPE